MEPEGDETIHCVGELDLTDRSKTEKSVPLIAVADFLLRKSSFSMRIVFNGKVKWHWIG